MEWDLYHCIFNKLLGPSSASGPFFIARFSFLFNFPYSGTLFLFFLSLCLGILVAFGGFFNRVARLSFLKAVRLIYSLVYIEHLYKIAHGIFSTIV